MRACANCGRLVANGALVACPQCGAPLPDVAPDPAPPWAPAGEAQTGPAGDARTPGSSYGAPAAPSQPVYPPANYPGYPYGGYPSQQGDPSQPRYPPTTYGQPAPFSQPLYPYSGYPPQPAAPSQPMYPYGGYQPGAPPMPYVQAPGANWRPTSVKSGPPTWLIATLVIVLVAVIASVLGYGAYALTVGRGGHSPLAAGANTTATPDMTPGAAQVLLRDPLMSNGNGWAESSHCFFDQSGYHIVTPSDSGWLCFAPIGSVANGRITVTAEQLAGSTLHPYGIAFRYNDPHTHYWFAIDSNSKWALFKIVNDSLTRMRDFTFNAHIHGGLHAVNTLTVEFRGQRITCAVNGAQVSVVTDSSSALDAGRVALEASDSTNVVFTNFVAEP